LIGGAVVAGFFSKTDLRLDTEAATGCSICTGFSSLGAAMEAALGAATVERRIGMGGASVFFSNMALRFATLFEGA
jgi:hypothetical protein